MFRGVHAISVVRSLVLLLSVAIYGVQVTGDENAENTESDPGVNVKEGGREVSAGDNWIMNLSWNLLGYATIIIPGAFIIRMLKNSNFNERSGTGCLFRSVQLCVFGSPPATSSIEDGGSKPSSPNEDPAPPAGFSQTTVKLLFCAGGLQISYLTWGVLQERIMTRTYEEHKADGTVEPVKFQNSQFLVFINRILALTIALVYIVFTRQPRHTAPLYK